MKQYILVEYFIKDNGDLEEHPVSIGELDKINQYKKELKTFLDKVEIQMYEVHSTNVEEILVAELLRDDNVKVFHVKEM